MFKFDLAKAFTKRVPALPFPRGAVSVGAPLQSAMDSPRFGAYVALAAIALGGMMMMANMAREHVAVPVAEAPAAAPAPTKPAEVAAAPISPPKPAPTPTATPTQEIAKLLTRVDTTPTGAIPKEPVAAKPKHKAHPKKPKELDSKR